MTKRTSTTYIVVHCSATGPGQRIGAADIREWHLAKGWSDIGYNFVVRRDGAVELGRDLQEVGAHVAGHNSTSVGVCMVGGLNAQGEAPTQDPAMFTPQQWTSMRMLITFLRAIYPHAIVLGHRDLSPDKNMDGHVTPDEWLKSCPGFDAAAMFANV